MDGAEAGKQRRFASLSVRMLGVSGIRDEQENEQAIVEIKKSGRTTFYELTPQEQAVWHTALEPVTHEMASRVGKDLIDEFQRETKVTTN